MRRRFFFIIFFSLVGSLLPLGALRAASLYLSPPGGSYAVGSTFNVTVGVNTVGVAINASQATISFSNDILEVVSVTKSGTFTLWPIEPSYSNGGGTVSYAGGVPNPGYTGSAGSIITIAFRGKVVGTASATIGSASVLANDGKGTNVLTSSGSGSYTIVPPEEKPPTPEKNLPVAPTIASPTHPDQNAWYANTTSSFTWTRQDGVTGFSFVFDDQATTLPDTVRDDTANQHDYSGTGDGVWYFHVRAQNSDGWGPAGHFRAQIDTTPPLPFTLELLDGKKTDNPKPRISFSTTDVPSGVHHYDLIINGGVPLGIDVGATTPYTFSQLAVGDYDITVIAYDYAGNSAWATASFTVVSPTTRPPVEEKPKEKLSKIEELLPEPIRQLTRQIGQVVQRLRENETITRTIDRVVAPVMTTVAAVVATGLAMTTTGFELFNMIYLFFRFGYFWLVPVTFGKRRKRWGVVFDSTTGRPIRRAVVRIFSREFNKLRESQITDNEGRFGFLVNPGEYFVTVTHPGFTFPSRLLQTATVSWYTHIYRGGVFTVKERAEGAVSLNVPVDPEITEVALRRLAWLRFLNVLGLILEKINTPLLVAGTLLSWIALIIKPTTLNFIVLGVYGLLLILKLLMTRRFERSWGLVTDAINGTPIEFTVIRIYNTQTGSIFGTRVTNQLGQFSALVPPGTYYLMAAKISYQPFQSRPVTVTKQRGLIRLGIRLMPSRVATPGAGGPVVNLEPMRPGEARPPLPAPPFPATPPVRQTPSPFQPPTPRRPGQRLKSSGAVKKGQR